ncbi:hypothetical protein [Phaeodactylibacter sp.]|uniref:hypothetical protein n=1 Tax=Phaeodactylibacter sp. TaxID=1940289 RepID=UPI0025E98061|nr:hypothetical protein [Phaeodactylibacter sp.]MCI5093484.1 hypothetical protein [Phaeodactylibacter sp.]
MKRIEQITAPEAVANLRYYLLKTEQRQRGLLADLDKGIALNKRLNIELKGLVLRLKDKELTDEEKEQLDFLINAIWQGSQEALEKNNAAKRKAPKRE